MTKFEFLDWFAYHCSRFTGMQPWLDKQPNEIEVMRAAYGVLRNVSLDAAKAASDQMHGGDPDTLPKGYDRHPAAIAAIARRNRPASRPTYHDGQQTVSCRDCGDYGFVHCWHPASLKKLAAGETANLGGACVVPCHCAAGDGRVLSENRQKVSRFDAARWCRLDWLNGSMPSQSEPEQQAALAWLESWRANRVTSAVNYDSDFAEFSPPVQQEF